MGLQFRLLGPLEVRRDERLVAINGVKPRQLLATLLLQPGRPVSVDRLIEVLWPCDPPRSAAANVQTYVSGLRTCVGDDRVMRSPPGYAVILGPGELDADDFLNGCAEAVRLRRLGYLAQAMTLLEQKLKLWRGQPLADLPASPLWRVELDELAERRLSALEDLLDLRIRLGDHGNAIAQLRGLTAEHPLREEMWALLIRALVAAERRADALSVYADVSRTLADELGVSPGPELRRLHLELLAADGVGTGPVSVRGPNDQLPGEAATLLRGLAMFEETSTAAWVAEALVDDGEEYLRQLLAARLVVEAGTDVAGQRRYRVPVLVRMLIETQPDRPADPDLPRALSGFLTLAEQAAQGLAHSPFGPDVAVAPRWQPPIPPPEPGPWFAAEHQAMLTAIDIAGRLDRSDLAWELALALVPWCDLLGHPAVWAAGHQAAQAICVRLDDRMGTAATLRGLGQLHVYRDEYAEAAAAFGRARLLFAQMGQLAGVASSLAGLGTVNRMRGDIATAIGYYQQALASYEECHHLPGQAYLRAAIGQVWLARGDLAQARTWLCGALEIAERICDAHRVAHLQHSLGVVAHASDDDATAQRLLSSALETFVDIGDVHGEAYALVALSKLPQPTELTAQWLTRALNIYQRLGNRKAEASTAEWLGSLHEAAGRRELAAAYLDEARRLHSDLDARPSRTPH
jgi:SARP family transcriptional regulator, regulator of embCAB operon